MNTHVARQATDLPRSAAYRSSQVSSRFLRNTQHVLLRYVMVFDGVDPVLIRMLRYVTVITAREV